MCLKKDRKISQTEHKQSCIVYINLLQLNDAIYAPILSGTGGSGGLLKKIRNTGDEASHLRPESDLYLEKK